MGVSVWSDGYHRCSPCVFFVLCSSASSWALLFVSLQWYVSKISFSPLAVISLLGLSKCFLCCNSCIFLCRILQMCCSVLSIFVPVTKTCLFNYTENFTTKKWKFSDKKKSDIFHISARNIDCEYSLEPPRWGGSNEYLQSMIFEEK